MTERRPGEPLRLRIEAFDLPGRACAGYDDIRVAVQRRGRPGELLDPQPGDAASASWTLDCTVADTPAGPDVRGPHVQGGPGGRFVYLSWVTPDDTGGLSMFRRAKLMLDAVDPAVVRGGQLLARLRLTDAKGQPLCASVRPPLVEWSVTGAP